jgi:hypothetical protein
MSNSHYHKVANSGSSPSRSNGSIQLIEQTKLLDTQSRKHTNRKTPMGFYLRRYPTESKNIRFLNYSSKKTF